MTRQRIIGIIAEYNPFHNGHKYHLEATRKRGDSAHIIAVMSGPFTQRGEPAFFDKWIRAQMAIENGVDIVFELPFLFSCNNAEFFAQGAMRLLHGLGCVDSFSFGSEIGVLDELLPAAKALVTENIAFRRLLSENLKRGNSYPKARYETLVSLEGEHVAAALLDPNNILAVEYLKEWLRLESKMDPLVILRKGPGHREHVVDGSMASGTMIRSTFMETGELGAIAPWISKETFLIFKANQIKAFQDNESLFKLIVYKILMTPLEELKTILSVSEGLENKLKKEAERAESLDDLVARIRSKRYTETRIRRVLIHVLLDVRKASFYRMLRENTMYARVLGLSPSGAALLRQIKEDKTSSIPILTNINREECENQHLQEMLAYDIKAADLYHLISDGSIGIHSDHLQKPWIVS